MDKRQKLIIVALGIVVAFAAYEHLPGLAGGGAGSDVTRVPEAARDAKAAINAVHTVLVDAEIDGDMSRMLTSVARDWSGNPFYVWPVTDAVGEPEEAVVARELDVDIIYAGFMEIAGRRFAVLNNTDYATGDLLEGADLRLREIHPQYVVLESTVDGEQYTVEYQDFVFFQ